MGMVRIAVLAPLALAGALGMVVASCSSDEPVGGTTNDGGIVDNGSSGNASSSSSSGNSGTSGGTDGSTPRADAGDGGDAGDAGEDAGPSLPPLDVPTTPAATTATIRAYVRDVANNAPLAGKATFEGTSFATAPAGELAFDGATGHHTIKVEASGYVPIVMPIGVTRNAEPFSFLLQKTNATSQIGAAGGTIANNGATLTFPSGAYASSSNVTATYITNLLATSGPLSFSDDSGDYQINGVLNVDVDTEPTKPVELKFPVSPGATAANLRMLTLGPDGLWGSPVMPTSVSGGFATYSVPHFTAIANGENATPSIRVRSVSGPVVADTPTTVTPQAGKTYPSGTQFRYAGQGGAWKVEFEVIPGGYVLIVGGPGTAKDANTKVDVTKDGTTTNSTCEKEPCALKINGNRPPSNNPGAKKYLNIRSRAVVMGVRGTTFNANVQPCGGDSKRARAEIEVPAGEVDFQVDGRAQSISGAGAEACVGCAKPTDTACCWVTRGPSLGVGCDGQNPVPQCVSASSSVLCPDKKVYKTTCGAGLFESTCGCTCEGPGLGPNEGCSYGTSCPNPPVLACAGDPTAAPACGFPDPVKNSVAPPSCRKKEDCPKAFAGCSAATGSGVGTPGICVGASD